MCRRAVGNREGTQKEKDKAQCVRSRGATHRIGVCRAGGRPRSTASGSAVSASDRPSSALGQWWSHWPPRASRQWHRARRCCHHCHQCHRTTPTLPPGALPPRPRARYPFLLWWTIPRRTPAVDTTARVAPPHWQCSCDAPLVLSLIKTAYVIGLLAHGYAIAFVPRRKQTLAQHATT